MKKRLIAALLVVIGSGSVAAKVTYDDAIKTDEQLNAANPHSLRTHGFTATELSLQTSGQSVPYLYGGMYKVSSGSCRIGNEFTGACNCPTGYSTRRIDLYNSDNLYFCSKVQ